MINKFLLGKKEFEGMEEEDIELIKERDAGRLRVMEGYCKTTSCLRRYILEYFGERVNGSCDNCGNCHHKYTEADMTADAKWVINCIAETRQIRIEHCSRNPAWSKTCKTPGGRSGIV